VVELNEEPHHADFLSRRIEDEILYRVLRGPLGSSLMSGDDSPGHLATVQAATAYLAEKVTQQISLAELAAVAHCSSSTLAKHFRQITGTGPMRFHKQLELQRARQSPATGAYTAASTAAAVGYVSASPARTLTVLTQPIVDAIRERPISRIACNRTWST
jgi:AraC-like DNA-binding protein